MARTATIIGHVRDFDGASWDVREARATSRGFDVLIGWPAGCRGRGYGGPRVIPTSQLVAYFDAHRIDRDGSIYDLPLGRSTIKRIRGVLGLNYYDDNESWWIYRLRDLSDMTGVRFAETYDVSQEMVSIMHTRLLGRRTRLPGWWRESENAALLISDLPRSYVADKLDLSVGAVGRLRWLLRKESSVAEEKGKF